MARYLRWLKELHKKRWSRETLQLCFRAVMLEGKDRPGNLNGLVTDTSAWTPTQSDCTISNNHFLARGNGKLKFGQMGKALFRGRLPRF